MEMTLREAVDRAAGRADVRAAVDDIYARLQGEIDRRKPRCDASGRCCRFETFGHRLYVTTLELAAFVQQVSPSDRPWDGTGCPYQIEGLCSVHASRPFGCRVFFCDSASDDWQHAQYERFHAELKRRHESLDVPYRYVEWRQALRELGLAAPDASTPAASGRNPLSLPQLPL
jgi:Fe-S-cluster containining protein